ncbi:MAG: ThiF family adenylyltransferase [Chloroflexi bacterium]|nr:ThiF family adenylyltransferase [Chloroflexota bacterium]
MLTLPLTIEKQYRVLLGEADRVRMMLVGIGGTGSWLALSLGRLAYHARSKGIDVQLTFVDHDVVELKNCGRQLFTPSQSEIGANKAVALAQRLNLALGLAITAIPRPFTGRVAAEWHAEPYRPNANLIIGAVDNAAARREIAAYVRAGRGRCWWLDCGNAAVNGQVLLGNLSERQQLKIDQGVGLLSGLPAPQVQEPGLLEPEIEAQPLSCADLALREEQSLMINAQVAAVAAQYVYDFTIKRCLRHFATYFTLEPPTAVSHPLTSSRLEKLEAMGWTPRARP